MYEKYLLVLVTLQLSLASSAVDDSITIYTPYSSYGIVGITQNTATGKFYATVENGNYILEINETSSTIFSLDPKLDYPSGIVYDRNSDNFFVLNSGTSRPGILKIDQTGNANLIVTNDAFSECRDLAILGSFLYFIDNTSKLTKVDLNGQIQVIGQFGQPASICSDIENGYLYIVSNGGSNYSISRVSSSGEAIASFSNYMIKTSSPITVNNGTLYIANICSNRIDSNGVLIEMSMDGTFSNVVFSELFTGPTSLVFDIVSRRILVANGHPAGVYSQTNVIAIKESGGPISYFVPTTPSNSFVAMDINSDGDVFVSNSVDENIPKIFKFSKDGQTQGFLYPNLSSPLSMISDITSRDFFVFDYNKVLHRVDLSGNDITVFDSSTYACSDLVQKSSGNIYLACQDPSIIEIDVSGRIVSACSIPDVNAIHITLDPETNTIYTLVNGANGVIVYKIVPPCNYSIFNVPTVFGSFSMFFDRQTKKLIMSIPDLNQLFILDTLNPNATLSYIKSPYIRSPSTVRRLDQYSLLLLNMGSNNILKVPF